MLRKSSADISGRGPVGPTATSDSSSTKKGSTSRGSIIGGRQGTDAWRTVARSKSLITSKALGTSGSFSSISPTAATAAVAAAGTMPSSGSNSLSAKRGSLPLGLKLRPPSPGNSRNPQVCLLPHPAPSPTLRHPASLIRCPEGTVRPSACDELVALDFFDCDSVLYKYFNLSQFHFPFALDHYQV